MLSENTALSESTASSPRTLVVLRDRFVLEERLEQGRFGTMYRAFDRARGQDGRPYVAILILPREVSSNARQLAAFERELAAVRALSHPNVVQIFALERDGDTSFLVLEWVDGESLRSVIDGLAPETVCEADALGVVRAVGNALVYAHARGVVHGDLRPENVLVTERGDVRLLFTSACVARGAPFTVGPRDDVRGLAALAYELMSGHPPPVPALYPHGKTEEPPPIEGLGRKRWKALRSALAARGRKLSSVAELLVALDLPAPRPPRRGARPDRVRSGRRGVLWRTIASALVVVGLIAVGLGAIGWWSGGGGSASSSLAEWQADAGVHADRAAEASRAVLSGARDRLSAASAAVAAGWAELGRRVAEASSDDSAVPAEPGAGSAESGDPAVSPAAGGPAVSPAAGEPAVQPSEAGDAAVADEDAVRDPTLIEAGSAPDQSSSAASEHDSVASDLNTGGALPAAGRGDGRSEPIARGREEIVARPAETDVTPSAARESAGAAAAPGAVPRITFARDDYVVSESAGVAAIEVRRQGGAERAVSFVWWTRDGSAKAGDDYADLGRVVEQLRAGETSLMLYVPIISDSIVEDSREHFEIHLGVLSSEGNQNGALESATVTIVDDDR